MLRTFTALTTLTFTLAATACTGNTTPPTTSATSATAVSDAASPATTEAADALAVAADAPFPSERCKLNKQAGTVRFLTGFDYAAAASIIEVVVAEHKGYYDELCLDVEVVPSFSSANYALVAGGEAQFASGGSFSEVAEFAAIERANLVAVSVVGQVPIGVLMVKPDEASSIEELRGKTIGVKTKMETSVAAMLAANGLIEGTDYNTVLLDGYDPVAHMALDNVVAVPGWRSNEPGTLERNNITVDVYDTADADIPGSFGVIFTSGDFIDQHPTAAQDFVRATLRGLNDAVNDPAAAAQIAVDAINGGGNPNYLSPEGEVFRWATDAETITNNSPQGFGIANPTRLAAEIEAYNKVGVYGDAGAPSVEGRYNAELATSVYDNAGQIIWPTTNNG